MNLLSNKILLQRSEFLYHVQSFLKQRQYLQVDTPCMTVHSGTDAYLDPFKINGKYLISSPELSLKKIWSRCVNDNHFEKIFEISHSFRKGDDTTKLHSAEFLMLEWYNINFTLEDLKNELFDLLEFLIKKLKLSIDVSEFKNKSKVISIKDFFTNKLKINFEYTKMQGYLKNNYPEMYSDELSYSDLFFSIFLNTLEPKLQKYEFPVIVNDYPAQLAALSETKDDTALRFELYWKGVELANAYLELTNVIKLKQRIEEDSKLRKKMQKEIIVPDPEFLGALSDLDSVREKNKACGIALGLDRLFMLLIGENSLLNVSPYKKK